MNVNESKNYILAGILAPTPKGQRRIVLLHDAFAQQIRKDEPGLGKRFEFNGSPFQGGGLSTK